MQRRQLIKALLAAVTGTVCGSLAPTLLAQRGRKAARNSPSRSGPSSSTRRRRRRRRIITRNMYLNSLPYGCNVTRIRAGVSYYHCGGIWYEPRYQGTTIIYVVGDIDSGAATNVEFEEYY